MSVKARCSVFTPEGEPLKTWLILTGTSSGARRFANPTFSLRGAILFIALWGVNQPIEHSTIGQVKRDGKLIGARRSGHIDPVVTQTHFDAVRLRLQCPA